VKKGRVAMSAEKKSAPAADAAYEDETIASVDNTREGGQETATAGEFESLRQQLEDARRESGEYRDEAARAKADFYNYRTRVERDRARDRTLAAEGIIESLLPVLDNLERALSASKEEESQIYKGVSMVHRQFFSVLQNSGLKVIEASGRFDPSFHEAVAVEEVGEESGSGVIIEQFHCGYMLGDKVLRAAQVKVGRKKAE
jgi:molecular chaperone GrpE (heat shock protein)